MNSDNSKKHHYIPQGILNEFSKKSRIWWHSKRLDIQKNQKTKEVAFKKHFYKYPDSDASLEIDFFTKIDSDAPEIIKKIINHECINVLSADEKYKLIKYIASQILRTPQSLNFIDQFEKTIKQQIHEDITILKENLKADYLNSILFNTTIHEDILKEKSFLLYKANDNERFIIGDCPVLTFHKRDCVNVDIRYNSFPPVINYDIYLFPISTEFILVFFNKDPSIIDDVIFYINLHNDFQFINSSEFVFAKHKETLLLELQKYNNNCYDYIQSYAPEIIDNENISRGEKLVITSPLLNIEEQARKVLRNNYIKSLINTK